MEPAHGGAGQQGDSAMKTRQILGIVTVALSLGLVASASVAEDGTDNLVYTFSRTGPNSSELTVYFTLSGTATACLPVVLFCMRVVNVDKGGGTVGG